jgi:hypothetical protein
MFVFIWIKNIWNNYTNIDPRSIAAIRVGLGLAGLLDIFISRLPYAQFFLTDEGVLPRHLVAKNYSFSFFLVDGSLWWSNFLLLIMAFVCLFLIVGFYSRLSIIIYYLLFLSLHWRNELILGGSDRLHLLISMWAVFLPLGCYASVDSYLKTSKVYPKDILLNINDRLANLGLLLLCSIMFLLAAYFKSNTKEWYDNFNALYYVLNTGLHVTPFGYLFKDQVFILKVLTCMTIVFEWAIGILLLIPIKVSFFRSLAAILIFILKAGFGSFLFVGLFPVMGLIFAFFFIPTKLWNILPSFDGLSLIYERLIIKISNFVRNFSFQYNGDKYLKRFVTVLLIFNIYLHLMSNADDLMGWQLGSGRLDSFSKKYIRLFRIDQSWVMFKFAPRWSFWPEVVANLGDGRKVDLWRDEWQGGLDVSTIEPKRVSSAYLNSLRFFTYHKNLSENPIKEHYYYFAYYLCLKWNRENIIKIKNIDYYTNYSYWENIALVNRKNRKYQWNYQCPESSPHSFHYKY